MKFENILSKEQVLCFNENLTYDELLTHCISYLKSLYGFSYTVEQCVNEMLDRDKLGNTAFNEGFAIPHARFDKIEGVNFLVAKTKNKIAVPQPTGNKDIDVFAVYLVSKTSPNLYLKILSSTIKLFNMNKNEYLNKIKASTNIEDIYKIFKESDIEIKHKLKVADIMNYYTLVVQPEDTIKEVMNRLYKHQANTAFVIDKEENLIGYTSITLLLKSVMPDYIEFLGDISFVKEFEPFEKLLREEASLKVKDVMGGIEQKLELESSILEAAYLITKFPKINIPVVDEHGKLKGTISPKAFLNKILRS